MKLVLTNGEKIDLGGHYCTWCFTTKNGVMSSNQIGITSGMSVNQCCDPVEILSEHNRDGNFFKVKNKLIPVNKVCYIEE